MAAIRNTFNGNMSFLGRVFIGNTTIPASGRLQVTPPVGGGTAISTYDLIDYTGIQFAREVAGVQAQVGSIYVTDIGTAFNTTSDQTLKVDDGLLTAEQAWAILDLVRIHLFRWKDTGTEDIGPFAQELFEVYPRAVTRGGWFDSEGAPANGEGANTTYRPWAVEISKLMPLVVVAMQDIHTTQQGFEQRLRALEA